MPQVVLADGRTYNRIGRQLTQNVIDDHAGTEFKIFRAITQYNRYLTPESFRALGQTREIPGADLWNEYHTLENYEGDRKVRMTEMFVANENIHDWNFSDVMMGAFIGGHTAQNFYFGADHPINNFVRQINIVRDAMDDWNTENAGKNSSDYTTIKGFYSYSPGEAVLDLIDSGILDRPFASVEQFVGGATITITPVFNEGKFNHLNVQIFNVTSVGSGNIQNGQSFIRPPTDSAQPYTNISQTFEFEVNPNH